MEQEQQFSNVRAKRQMPTSPTSKEAVLLCWLFLGWAGAHRMVIGSYAVGAIYAIVSVFSCGIFGILGWIDGFFLLIGTPRDQHGLPVVWSWKRGKLFVDPLEENTYTPAESLVRIFGNVAVLFLMPYVIVSAGLTLFETSQVKETIGAFAGLASICLAPLLLIQLIGTWRKARAQIKLLQKANALTSRTRLDAWARSASILTARGFLLLLTGLGFLVLSLAYKWADLGVIAVLALVAFYLMTAVSSFLTSFVVGRFSNDLLERGAAVYRSYSPGVVRAGDIVKDRLEVKGVPVPPGFFLTLEGKLPPRLHTDVRHVIPPKSREDRLSLDVMLRRVPRGTYDAPAMRIAFTDLLGVTSSQVASLATARLRVLPAVRPAEVIPPPPSTTEEPDILSRPHRFPTEDLFRFREYVAGDDTRRIHWEMSLRAGRMIVKTPESKETSAKRVCVALDTWIPSEWLNHAAVIDDALDSLVEAWLAIGQRLNEQGEKVSLLLVCRSDAGQLGPEVIAASGSHAHALDAGARAEWQTSFPIEHVLDFGMQHQLAQQAGEARKQVAFDNAIVVSMRLAPPMPSRIARETTWVVYEPNDALGPPPRTVTELWVDYDDTGRKAGAKELMKRVFFLPYPVGAEENGIFQRVKTLQRRLEDRAHRVALRWRAVAVGNNAIGALLAGPDAVYRLDLVEGRHRLVGLKGSLRSSHHVDAHQGQRRSA
ncbi:MAG: DUF58 domain-containing protein [Labilithrix sp.]|nr:DUF58 domain-containing protein [Labilithrix sp.]MCW5815621.1 DUF58 domain-containing protein [Labilithrix sp.]